MMDWAALFSGVRLLRPLPINEGRKAINSGSMKREIHSIMAIRKRRARGRQSELLLNL